MKRRLAILLPKSRFDVHDPLLKSQESRPLPMPDDPSAHPDAAGAKALSSPGDPEHITSSPDGRPLAEQPAWRQDFPIDWPQDNYIARRDFTKFLVLTSFAFACGQYWIAAKNLIKPDAPLPRKRIASLAALAVGSTTLFSYPGDHDPCILIRVEDEVLVAYSQKCTHLACAVVPKLEQGLIHCPCHEGYFDLPTGRVIAGPPPRPLPRIQLEISGDDIYATGIELRTV